VAEAVPVERYGRSKLFVAALKMASLQETSIELGTIEYEVLKTDEGLALSGEDFTLEFGEVLDIKGTVKRIAGVEYGEEVPVCRNFLGNCYPNPFNPTTTIEFSIKERSHVSLKIYNVAGQLVKTLVDEVRSPQSTGRVLLPARREGVPEDEEDGGSPVARIRSAIFSLDGRVLLRLASLNQ
jgi:hypothetical protein